MESQTTLGRECSGNLQDCDDEDKKSAPPASHCARVFLSALGNCCGLSLVQKWGKCRTKIWCKTTSDTLLFREGEEAKRGRGSAATARTVELQTAYWGLFPGLRAWRRSTGIATGCPRNQRHVMMAGLPSTRLTDPALGAVFGKEQLFYLPSSRYRHV
jgi:hypothetical protein